MTLEETFERFERRVTRIGLIAGIFVVFCIAGAVIYVKNLQRQISTLKLKDNTRQIEQVQQEQTQVQQKAIRTSHDAVKKAQTITTKIHNYEKPVIRDTTYAAMCEYITGFTPTE